MKIKNLEGIKDVFSIFHDGGISKASLEFDNLCLEIEIEYLAERINPGFRTFSLYLTQVANLMFTTWPDKASMPCEVIVDPKKIFILDIELLSAKIIDNKIEVACVVHNQDFEFRGGMLSFSAYSIDVQDESGQYYSVEDLRRVSDGYWNKWASRIK